MRRSLLEILSFEKPEACSPIQSTIVHLKTSRSQYYQFAPTRKFTLNFSCYVKCSTQGCVFLTFECEDNFRVLELSHGACKRTMKSSNERHIEDFITY